MSQQQSPVTYKRNPLQTGHSRLPVKLSRSRYYKATLGEAEAVFTLHEREVRVPYIQSNRQGGMSTLLDALVRDLGTDTIRFVNLSPPGVHTEVMGRIYDSLPGDPPENERELWDVLEGFDEVTEEWPNAAPGELNSTIEDDVDSQECICLVGTWEADRDV